MSTIRSLLLHLRDGVEGRIFPTVLGGDPEGAALALTFDDGPTPDLSERIGALLAERGHQATFFVLAPRATSHPDIIRGLLEEGHEVALHGLRHERLPQSTSAQIRSDLAAGTAELRALGVPEVRLVRPPFGTQTRASYYATRCAGLMPVGWSINVEDYRARTLDDVIEALDRGVRPGEILLLHDGSGHRPDGNPTPAECALRLEIVGRAVALLDDRGIRSRSVSSLMEAGARTGRWIRRMPAPEAPAP